jgi:hypothetical protein
MFPLSLFLSSALSSTERSIMNAYTFIPGNWTEVINGKPVTHLIARDEEFTLPDRPNITTFFGTYNDTELRVTVTSNTTGNATFGPYTFDFEFTYEKEVISIAEINVSDGSHISVSAYSDRTVEFCIFPHNGSGEINSFAFFKPLVTENSWWAVVLPIGIALLVTYLLKRFCPDFF